MYGSLHVHTYKLSMIFIWFPGSPGCLQHIACQQPQKAKKYVAAGDLLLKAAKVFSLNTDVNYHYVLQGMDQAANVGLASGKCSAYQCGTKDNWIKRYSQEVIGIINRIYQYMFC